jgi:hypothetical protein
MKCRNNEIEIIENGSSSGGNIASLHRKQHRRVNAEKWQKRQRLAAAQRRGNWRLAPENAAKAA